MNRPKLYFLLVAIAIFILVYISSPIEPIRPGQQDGDQIRTNLYDWNDFRKLNVLQNSPLPSLTILICSHAGNTLQRKALRDAWWGVWCNRPDSKIQCRFLISKSKKASIEDSDEEMSDSFLFTESHDDYYDLTRKVFSGFVSSLTLPPTDFIMKTDDDCYLMVDNLIKVLQLANMRRNLNEGLILSYWDTIDAHRIVQSEGKWQNVPYLQSTGLNRYPIKVKGCGYIFSRNIVQGLASSHKFVPFNLDWTMEDAAFAYFTSHMIATRLHHDGILFSPSDPLVTCKNSKELAILHYMTPEKMKSYHMCVNQMSSKH